MAPLRKCIYLNVNTLRVGTRASRLHNGDHRREEDAPAGPACRHREGAQLTDRPMCKSIN